MYNWVPGKEKKMNNIFETGMAEYIQNVLKSVNASVKEGKGVEKENISWHVAYIIRQDENEMHFSQE